MAFGLVDVWSWMISREVEVSLFVHNGLPLLTVSTAAPWLSVDIVY